MWKNSSAVRGLALEELDVVDQQEVSAAVAVLEAVDGGAVQRGDELVGEGLCRGVVDGQLRAVATEVVGDRAEEMGLAEPWGPVEEERVVGLAGGLGDCQGCGVGELVAGADDEALEGVVGIECDVARRLVVNRAARWGDVRGDQLDLADAVDRPGGGGTEQLHVATANPAQDALWAGQIQGRSTPGERGERREPEAVGVLGDGGGQFSLDLAPGTAQVPASVTNLPLNLVLLRRRGCEGAPQAKPRSDPSRARASGRS